MTPEENHLKLLSIFHYMFCLVMAGDRVPVYAVGHGARNLHYRAINAGTREAIIHAPASGVLIQFHRGQPYPLMADALDRSTYIACEDSRCELSKQYMQKAIHGLMVVFFGLGCALLWWMLTLVLQTTQRFLPGFRVPRLYRPLHFPPAGVGHSAHLWQLPAARMPGFTACSRARRGWDFLRSWIMTLQLMMLPTVIAAWLPLISIIEKIGAK